MHSVQFIAVPWILIFLLQFLGHVNGQYFVDPDVKLVDFWEGWGTSLAWWPDVLGDMPEDVIRKVTDDVFSVAFLCLYRIRVSQNTVITTVSCRTVVFTLTLFGTLLVAQLQAIILVGHTGPVGQRSPSEMDRIFHTIVMLATRVRITKRHLFYFYIL